MVSASRVQLAVGYPRVGAVSGGVADFASASFDRDYRLRGARPDSGDPVSAGANSWGATAQLNPRARPQATSRVGLAKTFASPLDRRH